ncbi:ATP-binding protein [Halobacteriovorax sp. JY17]|uniref:PAS domain-containing sensor histidine kinase n=1 Tax=Halobacteriovorax sp. JY17 TaxID=2014617 RepID=UPI000C6592A3|nr:ATP-binding protein [Halobacteriovorax sp. JY17]PIK16694.1 MAG: hypothetical protein CES88_08090 [Halobacteriovorax sp. JY17]
MKETKDYKISVLLGMIIIIIVILVTIPLFYNQFNSSMLLLRDKTIDDFKDEEKITQIFINSQLNIRSNKLSQYVNNSSLIQSLERGDKKEIENTLYKGIHESLDADFLFLTYDGEESIIDVSLNILNSREIVRNYITNNPLPKELNLYITENKNVIIFAKEEIISKVTGRVLATIHSGYIINNKNKFISGLSEKINNHNVFFLVNNTFVSGTQELSQEEIHKISTADFNQLIQVKSKLFFIGSIPIDGNNRLKVVLQTSSDYIKNLKSSYIINFILTLFISIFLCILTIYLANRTITPPLEGLLSTINLLMIRNIPTVPRKSIIREFNVIEENFIEVFNNFQKKKSQLAKFIDSSPISLLILDYKGNIIQTNKAAIELFQIKQKNGNILLDTVLTENSQFNKVFTSLKERSEHFELEMNFKSTEVWKNTIWTFIQDKKEDYIFIQCIDNTEKVETQAQIEAERSKSIHNQKLAAIGEVASSIAHEINNPMGIISLSLTMLEHELSFIEIQSEEKKNKISTTMRNIESSVNRTSKIISNLLDFSREGSKDKLESKNLNTILSKTLIFIEEKMKKNKIKLDISSLDTTLNIITKETQFSQVLVNLINNSIDALKDSSIKEIKISTEVKEDICVIHFIDSGPGIPKVIEEEVFSPFYTTKGMGSGTGLGLSISRQLMREMSGDLILVSEAQESGAHFEVSIPIGKPTQS